jgi:glycosyltransferase involved in cell wall biosynthesis
VARVVMIAPYAKYYIFFCWELLETLACEGHEVIAIAPDKGFESKFKSIGVHYKVVSLENTGTNPMNDIYSIYVLTKVLKRLKPDVISCYAIKPVLYGSFAARFAKLTNVHLTITGLGYVFIGTTIKQKVLLPFIKALYKFSLKYCRKVFFQNLDDLTLFKSMGLLESLEKTFIVNGSGVNISYFSSINPQVKPLTIIIVARLIKDKGIEEFVEASRILKRKYPFLNCRILGPYDNNPTSISREKVNSWVAEGVIEYLGETNDVRPFLLKSSVFVLPSYREGTPKAALEAMAMGLPIITTDAPGCKETVINNENGFLVPVKDSKALAKAIEMFVLDPSLVSRMGKKSREIAVHKYDVHKVNDFMIKQMGLSSNPNV